MINSGNEERSHISDEDDSQISVVLGYRLTAGPERALLTVVRIHPEFHGPAWYKEARRQLWLRDTRTMMSLSHVHESGVMVGDNWFIHVAIKRLTRSRAEYCQVQSFNKFGNCNLKYFVFFSLRGGSSSLTMVESRRGTGPFRRKMKDGFAMIIFVSIF